MLRRRYINTFYLNTKKLHQNLELLKRIDSMLVTLICGNCDDLKVFKITNRSANKKLKNIIQQLTGKFQLRNTPQEEIYIHCMDKILVTIQVGQFLFVNFESILKGTKNISVNKLNKINQMVQSLSDLFKIDETSRECLVDSDIRIKLKKL